MLKLLFGFKVEGLENLPQKSNFIIAANHTSFLDPILIGAAIPKRIYWVALKGFYNIFWLKWVMDKFESLPTGSASEKVAYLLTKNKNIGLFPEGTRSYDGKLREFKRGVAVLALRTGRPVVPCAIQGAYGVFPRGSRFPRLFYPIKVKVGKPRFLLKEFDEVIDDIYLQEGVLKIRKSIKEMLDDR